MSAHHQQDPASAGKFHGKRSLFTVSTEDARPMVLETPAPTPLAPAFGLTWERLTLEIERHISARDVARQAAEDERAVRRNRNRMLTLLFALLIGIVVTYTLSHGVFGPHISKTFGPYAFVITVMLDSTLALYSWIRRY